MSTMSSPGHRPPSPALELRDLRCVRGTRVLFSDLALKVASGQLLWVRGANGSGKTSLLRLLCGLSIPAAGEVRWRGLPVIASRDSFHLELVYLAHDAALKGDLSAHENLQAAAALAGLPCSAHDITDALAQAGLRGREHLPARRLSQGQRNRAALARLALGAGGGLWVLDEPFNALDDAAAAWLEGLVATQLARGGVVVLTSHQERRWNGRLAPLTLTLPQRRPAAADRDARLVESA